jgi:hypothetical protein
MKRMFAIGMTLLLAGVAAAEERFLFQVFLKNVEDRAQVASSGLTPYALLENSLIVEGTKGAATASGLAYRVIFPAPAKGTFYLVIPPFGKTPSEVRGQVAERCEILAEDADAFFVRAAPEAAEELPSKQVHIVRVWMTPIDLGFAMPSEPPRVMAYNPVIQWIIDQITPTEITGMLRDLSGKRPTIVRGVQDTIRTRYTPRPKNSSAIWYFYEKYASYAGIDSVKFHSFTWSSYTDSNVVATKVGRVYPRKQYLIDGHIDCTSQTQYRDTLAPGADDNASGTIAALIAAKVVRQIPFKRTIKCIAFNTEEQGLYGSARYASEARARGDSILGVLNGDMIGTNYTGNNILVAYNGNRAGSIVLTNRLYEVDTTYHLGLTVQRSTSSPTGSDHYSFWQNGYESGYLEENDFSQVYHTIGDTIGRMDTLYWTKALKCMVAALCDLAEPDTTFSGVETPGDGAVQRGSFALNALPNPAQERTEVRFLLPQTSEVTLDVYDLSGRRIQRLAQGLREAGSYSQTWDAQNAPAGVYFVRLSAGKESLTQRLVLLR